MTQEAIALRTTGDAYPGLAVVQDVNKALQTIATDFAGAADPAALAGPFMTWADTGNMLLKRRNAANSDWVVEGSLLLNSGTNHAGTEPTNPVAYMTWADAGNMLLKRRNAANSDWVVEGRLFANRSVMRSAIIPLVSVGSFIDFTGVPSTARRVTVKIIGAKLNAAKALIIRVGNSGGVVPSGYATSVSQFSGGTSTTVNYTTGFLVFGGNVANNYSGVLELWKMQDDLWIGRGIWGVGANALLISTAGFVSAGGDLSFIRIQGETTPGAFDAGSAQIEWGD